MNLILLGISIYLVYCIIFIIGFLICYKIETYPYCRCKKPYGVSLLKSKGAKNIRDLVCVVCQKPIKTKINVKGIGNG